ncbi:MAG: AAA family ATPase [Spirochaetales bacterium]|nr:AAA family ATPase [Spirochaetales bacterium]
MPAFLFRLDDYSSLFSSINSDNLYKLSLTTSSESQPFKTLTKDDWLFLIDDEDHIRGILQIVQSSPDSIDFKKLLEVGSGVTYSEYSGFTTVVSRIDDREKKHLIGLIASSLSDLLDFNGTTGNKNLAKEYVENSEQIIFYGVPGSGKSNMIENRTSELNDESTQKVRVVFHPDYSNADFVGQIMPKKDGDSISYEFKAGPFTMILKKAYDNPKMPFYLIIEEINRGNAAAIFGDVFQLLDRDNNGWSKYEITNEEVSKIIYGDEKAKDIGFNVKLPPNLSILATMNTSDQNVFTLDNAFQRRWTMVHVKNEFQNDSDSNIQKNSKIKGTELSWENFLFGVGDKPGINAIISSSSYNSGMSSLEDKRIGCWFVVNKGGWIKAEDFSNKVLKYLWDDAFHFDKSVFSDGIESFDKLVDAFENRKQLFKELEIEYVTEGTDEPTEAGA